MFQSSAVSGSSGSDPRLQCWHDGDCSRQDVLQRVNLRADVYANHAVPSKTYKCSSGADLASHLPKSGSTSIDIDAASLRQ